MCGLCQTTYYITCSYTYYHVVFLCILFDVETNCSSFPVMCLISLAIEFFVNVVRLKLGLNNILCLLFA